MNRAPIPFVLLTVALAALGGCGSNESGSADNGETAAPHAAEQVDLRSAANALEANFQLPAANGLDKRQVAALRTGQRACRGMVPAEVRNRYLEDANSNPGFAGSPLGRTARSPEGTVYLPNETGTFPAGLVAGATYYAADSTGAPKASLLGCVYEMAKEQARRLRVRARG